MKHHHTSRLNAHEQEQAVQQSAQQQAAVEFANTEAMLRHDASQAEVPPAVAERLRESIKREAPPPQTWWQRWFGRNP
jgi:hypothetical protein